MQKPRFRVLVVLRLRRVLTYAICAISLVALLSVHLLHLNVFPSSSKDSYKLSSKREFGYQGWGGELGWTQEVSPPQFSKSPSPSQKLNRTREMLDLEKQLWKPPSNRDFTPCVEPNSSYLHVFDEDYFINSLANDVKIIKKLPKELANATRAVKHFRSWSGMDYYQDEIVQLWDNYQVWRILFGAYVELFAGAITKSTNLMQVIRAAKSDSRLANNNLPLDIQKLRCRAMYEAIHFAPQIEAMGKLLVERIRSYGPYVSLHLRYEKDMLAFSGCTHGLSDAEADELTLIRENTAYWKVKEIDSREQRAKGYCPLTPKEAGIFLSALGYPLSTPIYIAAGEIYGGDKHMDDLRSRFPLLMSKEKLASAEELEPFINHASQMAALDYIVSIESDVFIPSYSGNMARAVEGHRRFLGHRKVLLGREKVPSQEQGVWTGLDPKNHFMRTLYQNACAGKSCSRVVQIFPMLDENNPEKIDYYLSTSDQIRSDRDIYSVITSKRLTRL
ncbi:hypothetical protein Scep_000950 [Stephania cephalantha]|uniref:O-fucosyltransferase family protein n=1 Tax=Stephania cephalantha TaxID=152367 RepID=A0AAP0Q4L2_9MAGN